MPRLFRTPEQVLRKTRLDLYLIRFMSEDALFYPQEEIPGRRELLDWFQRELPCVELEDLGPPEGSGFLAGGIGIFVRVAFDEASLSRYVEVWENADGSSKDARWACYLYPFREQPDHR